MQSVPSSLSMRERNKVATRSALAEAAVQLAMRDGLAAVRNEDIAELAGVSPRTFSNYFANKYEALTFRHTERMRYAADALLARPAAEPLWDAIRAAISAPWVQSNRGFQAPRPAAVAELRLLFGARALQGEILKDAMDPYNAFARAIAGRLGLDVERDLYPRLLAASVTMATQIAIDAFLQSDPPVAQLPLVLEALRQLSAGFPEPAASVASNQQDDLRERAQ